MAKGGPVLFFESDMDEQEIINNALQEMDVPNKILFFNRGEELLAFLRSTEEKPFMIVSDIKAAGMDGIDVRSEIEKDPQLKKKSIPFIYLSISAPRWAVDKAYELTVQGFFLKQDTISDVKDHLKRIFDYWSICLHPNQ